MSEFKTNTPRENSKAEGARKVKRSRKISERYLRNSGLYYLQRYTASTAHFRKVMTQKITKSCDFHQDQDKEECLKHLETVIAEFLEMGYLDDSAYARGTVFSLRRKGLSARMIQMRMKQKGIDEEITTKMLDQYAYENPPYDDEGDISEDFRAAITLAKRKKIGPYYLKPIKDEEEKQKLYARWLGAFGRAGFDYQTCRKVLELDLNEFEDC